VHPKILFPLRFGFAKPQREKDFLVLRGFAPQNFHEK
jgi:hypothetical protein